MDDQIKCPKCGTQIKISAALSQQAKDEIEKVHKLELGKIQTQMKKQEEEFEKRKKSFLDKQKRAFEVKQTEIEKQAREQAEQKASEKFRLELKDLKERDEENNKRIREREDEILETRKKAREAEEEARKAKLETEKKLEKEIGRIKEETKAEALKKADEEHRLKDLEKDKKISDLAKALEEAKRKAEQGSQQNQGEVLELDLEKILPQNFVYDLIEPIAKGVSGADIIQRVRSKSGAGCGSILFEVKQTKNWSDGWVAKLKDDLRQIKANIPVLVSMVLPKEMDGFGFYQGIWVSSPKHVIALVMSLRKGLIAAAYERSVQTGKGKKSELLFEYVSSHEFRQKVEALVEVYNEMQEQINKERIALERSWSRREKQVIRLMQNTAGMYGDMQGLVGSSLGEIKGLELGEEEKQLDSGQEKMF